MNFLDTPIDYLKGVGPTRAQLLKKELKIFSFGDLLWHYPFRYIDKTRIYNISDLVPEISFIQIRGKIIKFEEKGHKSSRRLIAHFSDNTGNVQLVWFKGIKWIKSSLKLDVDYIVYGKPSIYQGSYNIVHPELDKYDEQQFLKGLQAVYHSTDLLNSRGLNSRAISKLVKILLPMLNNQIDETLSRDLIEKNNLPSNLQAYHDIHCPLNTKDLIRAQKRLKFEEFFFFQLHLLKLKVRRKKEINSYPFIEIGNYFNNFYKNNLPFDLTNAQKKVLKEIRNDLRKPEQMNRLLQGDVGSGKTLVALLSMLIAIDNQYQSCLMAPTEILAQQHFQSISKYLLGMQINVHLLTGSTKKRERDIIYKELLSGEINL